MNLRRLMMQNCPSRTKPTRGQSCASQQKFAASREGSIASVGLSWHAGFTPDCGRIAAGLRTDASGQDRTHAVQQAAAAG